MLQLNFLPFPVIETPRLLLRNFIKEDAEAMFEIRSNSETMRYMSRPLANSMADAEVVIEMILSFTSRNERINWAIVEKDSNKMIGMIGFPGFSLENYRGEVGYVLNHNYTGNGYATEALIAVLKYAFLNWNLHSIEAAIHPENRSSVKLVEKLGFVKEAYFKEYVFHNGQFWDRLIYTLWNPGK